MVGHLGNAVPEALALLDGEEGVAILGAARREAGSGEALHHCGQAVVSLSSKIGVGQRVYLEQLHTSFNFIARNERVNWHDCSRCFSLTALIEVLVAFQVLVFSWRWLVIEIVHFLYLLYI
mgnify:FL=1